MKSKESLLYSLQLAVGTQLEYCTRLAEYKNQDYFNNNKRKSKRYTDEMTEEDKYLSDYIISIIEKESDEGYYFKDSNDYLPKSELISLIKTNKTFTHWFFLIGSEYVYGEGLWEKHQVNDDLGNLVFRLNDKFMKVIYDNYRLAISFQFVEPKSIIMYYHG